MHTLQALYHVHLPYAPYYYQHRRDAACPEALGTTTPAPTADSLFRAATALPLEIQQAHTKCANCRLYIYNHQSHGVALQNGPTASSLMCVNCRLCICYHHSHGVTVKNALVTH